MDAIVVPLVAACAAVARFVAWARRRGGTPFAIDRNFLGIAVLALISALGR